MPTRVCGTVCRRRVTRSASGSSPARRRCDDRGHGPRRSAVPLAAILRLVLNRLQRDSRTDLRRARSFRLARRIAAAITARRRRRIRTARRGCAASSACRRRPTTTCSVVSIGNGPCAVRITSRSRAPARRSRRCRRAGGRGNERRTPSATRPRPAAGPPLDRLDVRVPLGRVRRVADVRRNLEHRPLDHDLGHHVDSHHPSSSRL